MFLILPCVGNAGGLWKGNTCFPHLSLGKCFLITELSAEPPGATDLLEIVVLFIETLFRVCLLHRVALLKCSSPLAEFLVWSAERASSVTMEVKSSSLYAFLVYLNVSELRGPSTKVLPAASAVII